MLIPLLFWLLNKHNINITLYTKEHKYKILLYIFKKRNLLSEIYLKFCWNRGIFKTIWSKVFQRKQHLLDIYLYNKPLGINIQHESTICQWEEVSDSKVGISSLQIRSISKILTFIIFKLFVLSLTSWSDEFPCKQLKNLSIAFNHKPIWFSKKAKRLQLLDMLRR